VTTYGDMVCGPLAFGDSHCPLLHLHAGVILPQRTTVCSIFGYICSRPCCLTPQEWDCMPNGWADNLYFTIN
jgi:hypothetical protein